MFDVLRKRILFVTSGRLTAFSKARRKPPDTVVFKLNDDGIQQFGLYLASEVSEPVHLLTDFVEEEFREDTVPHVFSTDRRAVINTKLGRLFRDTTYTRFRMLGRESTGRRDDRVLLSAVTRPELLSPWVEEIDRQKVPLAGIYSLPILSQRLLKNIPVPSTQALLVTLQNYSGLRQTFFKDDELKVSRLALVPRLEATQYASYILSEVERTRRYLGGLNQLDRESPLDVFVLAHGGILSDLTLQATNTISTRHHFVDVADAAQQVGLKRTLETSFCELIYAKLLDSKTPPNDYASSRETRYFSMNRLRFGMQAAGVLLLLGSIIWSGFEFLQGIIETQDARSLERQIAFYDSRYRQARAELPETPASGHDVKLAVEAIDTLREQKTSPLDVMATLSQALNLFPSLQVDQVEWKVSANPDDAAFGASRSQPAQRLYSGQIVAVSTTGRLYQITRLRGRIDPFGGDYRAAEDTIRRFADSLSRLQGVESVDIVSLPLNTSSQERLQGTAGPETVVEEDAPFELKLVLTVGENEAS